MSVSLDGYIEAPGGDLNWSTPDVELHRHFNEQEAQVDVAFYERGLYELMSAYWPTAEENPEATPVEIEYAQIWKRLNKVVFSTTLDKVDWNSRLVRGDLAEEVNKLKAEPGDGVLSVGGAGLAASFTALGLIDEYHLYFHPVLLGGGKPMIGAMPAQLNLKLIENHTFKSGVVLLKYQKANTGS
jgi:dihydrofolate reductase